MNIFYIIIMLGILAAMLADPAAALQTAQATLGSWWSKVLPALLPFFIISELCSRIGLINALGAWLTPVMRPLFRLPGAAAVGVLLGFFSGSPTGGAIAAELRRQKLLSQNEGERMLAFCNNAGPLYILITVAALLGDPAVGLWLAAVQYPVNLALGLLLRFAAEKPTAKTPSTSPYALWRQGVSALKAAPKLPISILLKESSLKALTNIGMIGAFMLCFSLLLLALNRFGLNRLLEIPLYPLCALAKLPADALPALSDGLFEMTLGVQRLAETDITLFEKLLAASVILGWSGLSIHAQIAGVCSESGLRLKYYLPCRVLHAVCAPLILLILQDRITLNSSTFSATNLPEWLTVPGALLLPAVLLLLFLLIIAFGRCALLWKRERRRG